MSEHPQQGRLTTFGALPLGAVYTVLDDEDHRERVKRSPETDLERLAHGIAREKCVRFVRMAE